LSELVKIGSLTPRSRGVNLVAKVVEKPEPRVVSSQYDQSEHRLTEALIADETGAITLVLWDDNINMVSEGDSIKVTNGFVKLFKGRMQLNLGRYGKVEQSDVDVPDVNLENNLSQKEGFQQEGRERKSEEKV
jgi:replication factor A1